MNDESVMAGPPVLEDVQSITDGFQSIVQRYPECLAIISRHQSGAYYSMDSSGGLDVGKDDQKLHLRWTYRTLDRIIRRLAKALSANDVREGTPIFVFCQNQVESIILTIAAYRLGLIHVPIDPGVLSNITDVQHMVDTVIEHYHPDHVAILANDATTAERLDQVMLGFPTLKICIEPGYAGWTSFENLLDEADAVQNEEEEPTRAFDERSVFFTSGSTSLPKCCLNKPALWFHVLGSSLTLGSASPQDSVLVTVPTSHAFGYICMMMSLLRGACVVFASARFNSQLVVNTMKQERCTHAAIVPTMVHSLVGELASSGTKVESLKGVTLAGAAIGLELLETCKECLGVTTVENFYGMTEGVFATTGPVEELGQVVNGRDVAVGKPVQGAKLRICAPDDSSIVPRGVPGELHYSGHSVIRGYVGDRTDDFYEANGEPWFITGDRALVDHEGRLFILGRRKDMIVRGGKNISLPKIERVLSQVPEMCALEPQIVAAADPIAGEVPLAVIKRRTDYSLAKQLQDTILSSLGVAHVPVQVVALETLGLADYPRTPAGKIKKPKLAETVRAYLESQAADDIQPLASVTNLTLKVQSVWARVLGYRLVDLDIKRPISEFADSIIMLIARDKIRKETGRSIPLTQWNISKTISEQIHLLENGTTENRPNSTRSEPPHVEQIVHLGGNEGKLHATKATVNKTISQYGLCWDDVADVCPCTDFIQLVSRARAIDDWNIRTSIVTRDASTEVRLERHQKAHTYLERDILIAPARGLESNATQQPTNALLYCHRPDRLGTRAGPPCNDSSDQGIS
jgi:acyl-CoA synthetase (AMP-forming)/AMP-acid ligase II